MSWWLTILVGIITSIASGAAACGLAVLCVEWYRISSFEGGSGYYVVFITLIGLIAGLILGVAVSRFVAPPGFLPASGYSLGAVAVLFGVVVLFCRLGGDVPPKIAGEKLDLEVELRCPRGLVPKIGESSRYVPCSLTALGWGNQRRSPVQGEVLYKRAQESEGQWTIPCRVFLYSDRSKRILGLTVNEGTDVQILLPLAGSPGEERMQWSEWRSDQILQETGKTSTAYSYRFRVRRRSEVRREVWKETEDEQKRRDREFAALTAEDPLDQWLKFAAGDDGKSGRVGEVVAARMPELPALIQQADQEQLRGLTAALSNFRSLPANAAGPLRETGEALTRRFRAFDLPKSDRATEMIAQLRGFYWVWHEMAGHVDGCAIEEFRPVLKDLREIAEARREENFEFAALADTLKSDTEELKPQPTTVAQE